LRVIAGLRPGDPDQEGTANLIEMAGTSPLVSGTVCA
jgi:hypothetical protein